MSVDILPSSLPLDASTHFSDVLVPYLSALIREYRGEGIREEEKEYVEALRDATVASRGELQGKHEWLQEPVEKWRSTCTPAGLAGATATGKGSAQRACVQKKKKVLVLGSGMVAGPAVEELCKHGDVELVVGQ